MVLTAWLVDHIVTLSPNIKGRQLMGSIFKLKNNLLDFTFAFGRHLRHRSRANSVAEELNVEVNELIRAARRAAIISPLNPEKRM